MNETIIPIDRWYRDSHGVPVHVIGWDYEHAQIIFKREGYEHECMQPLRYFRTKFTRIRDDD
ncbi:DUF4222 domain-containing protein [Hafnia paralvei]|uniref:DUF4222 domain-containing protein n=1 Tax=Hafnia paralvei TaxID=546367 RepID=UPI0020002947|nr:DUF4222 domain-containing protein [Hafnia paralvei]